MAARTARCAVLHAAHVVWICVGLLQHITRAAQAQIFNICVKLQIFKGRAGRFGAVNEHHILRKYTFELSQIRFS